MEFGAAHRTRWRALLGAIGALALVGTVASAQPAGPPSAATRAGPLDERSVITSSTFGPFDSGSSELDCDAEATQLSGERIRAGVRAAAARAQQSVLLVVGATDRAPLSRRLLRRYGSSAGLAAARANAVMACLFGAPSTAGTASPPRPGIVVPLVAGPAYTPGTDHDTAARVRGMGADRRVVALLLATPLAPQRPGVGPPGPRASEPAVTTNSGSDWRGALELAGIVFLLLLLGLLLLRLQCVPKPAQDEFKPERIRGEQAEAAITHVRSLHEMFAELRTKNFNFFLIIIGAAITGVTALAGTGGPAPTIQFVVCTAAAIACVVFFGIECRTVEMLGDARQELERLEPAIGVYLHRRDRWINPKRSRWVSHTAMYRFVFVVTYFVAIVAMYLNFP